MRYILLAIMMTVALWANALTDTISVSHRLSANAAAVPETFGGAFSNPTLMPYRMPFSLSRISAGYTLHTESVPLETRNGSGYSGGEIDAQTYIHQPGYTIWGHASYQKGRQNNVKWNESADAELIYPYISADSIGGDLDTETYKFGGGYVSDSGKWIWAAYGEYSAAIYYRNVDPRPKNTTGMLSVKTGAGYKISQSYVASLSVSADKYKQTNDIDFISEMGKTIVYHLTGLGNHYNRFAGEGDNSYFDGWKYGITANIYPTAGSGVVAWAGMSRFTFKKVLTDLNKLPLCRAWHNAIAAQIGYLSEKCDIAADFSAYRRHGIENLFGDASSNIYPQIGEIEAYADNSYTIGLAAKWRMPISSLRTLAVMPRAHYAHRSTVYAQPASQRIIDYALLSIGAKYAGVMADKWAINASATYDYRIGCRSRLISPEETIITAVVRRDFANSTKNVSSLSLSVECARELSDKYAIGIKAYYAHQRYGHTPDAAAVDTKAVYASAEFIF